MSGHVRGAEEISQSLPVPDTKIGWLVGKRGSYVRQLCRKSGAQISISDSTSREYGIAWKYVQITGTGRAVDRAKKLIHIRLSRLEARPTQSESDVSHSNSSKASSSSQSRRKSPPESDKIMDRDDSN